jgi:catechol 2,3-dioxygenase-like lactoylglutathione lyase family enzyme
MIGVLDGIILDCDDPRELAAFYAELLGVEVLEADEKRAEIDAQVGPRPLMAFQRVRDYRRPDWPGTEVPRQIHLDVRVEDLDKAEVQVLALGATRTGYERETYRIYLDPAGHPFCLIQPND